MKVRRSNKFDDLGECYKSMCYVLKLFKKICLTSETNQNEIAAHTKYHYILFKF